MTSGIYCIENLVNNKKYIGKSKDIETRWIKHKSKLLHKNHPNKHLSRAWEKYGEESFKLSIIETCDEKESIEKEIFYISYFNTRNNGYNMTDGGEGKPNYVCSEETRKRMSKAGKGRIPWNKGIPVSEELRQRLSEARKGKPHTEATKKRMAETRMGKHLSEETKKRISTKAKERNQNLFGENNPFYARHHSEETKKRMSEAKKGKNIGIEFSEERKRKISEAKKKYWENWRLENGR